MVFVVVMETGVYDDFNYEVHSVYESREDAERCVELLEYEDKLEKEVDQIYGNRIVVTDFEIHEVPLIANKSMKKTTYDIDKEYALEIEKAKEWINKKKCQNSP